MAAQRRRRAQGATATHVRVLAWSHVPVTRVTATLLATGQLLELRRWCFKRRLSEGS